MMNVRHKLLLTILGLMSGLSACSTVSHIEYSSGLKSRLATLPKDSVVVIFDPNGMSLFADSDGKLATPCNPPTRVMKGETQVAITDKSTCTGLQKGFVIETLHSSTVIKSFANPHPCFCFTRGGTATTEQICRPVGCTPHP